MKIGELARRCGVSPATIRYYVRNGMLVPNDSGAQYDFTQREYQDLQLILRMKQKNFSLKEIQDYLVLTRHSNFIEPDTIGACLKMWEDKRAEISAEVDQLQQSIRDIDREISTLRQYSAKPVRQTGVPVSALGLLACPYCGRQLMVDNASIQENFIYSGILHCGNAECHENYQAVIEHGIVKTGNIYTAPYDAPDLKRGLYRNMVSGFSSALQKCSDYFCDRLKSTDLGGKVLLEGNINGYFFLYRNLELIPENCICVVMDKYSEMLEMYKTLIEQMEIKANILYIADAGERFPLRDNCVDLCINYFGENEYQFYHKHTFLQDVARHLKPNARMLGALISYDKASVTRQNLAKKYPEASSHCHQMDYLKEDYRKLGYHIELTEAGCVTDSGIYQYSFSCHVRGEPLRVYHYTAARDRKDLGEGRQGYENGFDRR